MTDSATVLLNRRRRFIHELESGNRTQRSGRLFGTKYEDVWDAEQDCFVTVQTNPGFCCIGVGCDLVIPNWIGPEDVVKDGAKDYQAFRIQYEVSDRMMQRLVKMNDGGVRNGYHNGKFYAADVPQRSFKFIARFLRIIWKIED